MESSVETNRQEEKSGSNSSIVNNVVMQYLESSIIKDDDDPNKNNGNNHATTKQQRDTTTPENGKDAAAAAAAAAAVKEEEEEESLSSPNKRKRRPPTARWDDSTADITPNKNKNTKEEEKDTKPKKNKTDKNKNNEDEEDGTDDMAWICAECKEADYMVQPSLGEEFLICDGNCHRIFHYPCAGLSELPKSDQDWVCKDCTNQQHQCAFCHEYGNDDEDVFLCPKPKCGLFFHESCLAMQNVEVKTTAAEVVQQHSTTHSSSESRNGDNADDEMGAINNSTGATTQDARSNAPVFICPAHNCWTCTQKDAKEVAEKEEKNNAKTLKKKKKKKAQSIFQCKTEHRLFRCLYCPLAYHATCIPPTSRFHELAVLCHEHASTHKLPDLDLSTSLQSAVEDKIDRKLLKMNRVKKTARRKGASYNPFFPGLRGDRLERQEKFFLEYLTTQNEKEESVTVTSAGSKNNDMVGDLRFCLPCDVKNEVHSKPQSYKHTHCQRFDPNNRPKRIPTGERCQCTGKCGDDCFNRMTSVECFGDGSRDSNCYVGGDDCGNRSLAKRQYVKCKPKREGGKGWGLETLEAVPKGKLVLEYVGEIIDEATMEKRMVEWNKEHPNDPNFYVMAVTGGWYVDAREYANMSRFINHSCAPNCSLTTVNVKGYKRCAIFSKRDIAAGEFLSYDYQFDTKQGDRFHCRCGAKTCRGTMKGGLVTEAKKPLNWKEAKARYEADKKFLDERKGNEVISQVSVLIPAAEQPTDFVFAGPLEKHKDAAIRNGIFLWRNADRGADFVSRNSRLDSTTRKKEDNTKASFEEKDILSIMKKSNSGGGSSQKQ